MTLSFLAFMMAMVMIGEFIRITFRYGEHQIPFDIPLRMLFWAQANLTLGLLTLSLSALFKTLGK